jgi:hypothetical protein
MDIGKTEGSTNLLQQKYDLHNAPEVAEAAHRREIRTGIAVPQKPLDRIQNYLNRFREITDREDPEQRERGVEAIRRLLHRKYIIKPDEIPESYWENQRSRIKERGQGAELEHADRDEIQRQNTEAIIANQISSMDTWIDYLSSSDAPYPDWFKYYASRSVLEMNKGTKTEDGHIVFGKRVRAEYDEDKILLNEPTIGPFPELDREALAYVADSLQKKYGEQYFVLQDQLKKLEEQHASSQKIDRQRDILRLAEKQIQQMNTAKIIEVEIDGKRIALKRKDIDALRTKLENIPISQTDSLQQRINGVKQEFNDYLDQKNLPPEFREFPTKEEFATLYAYAIEKVTPASKDQLAVTKGGWAKIPQGSDPMNYPVEVILEDRLDENGEPKKYVGKPLVPSLQGHGTGWCTAGESTAKISLQGGDFYVYYSNDPDGNPTIPRVAIRMEGEEHIAEVRGIAPQQNLDPYVGTIVEEKLAQFSDGKEYQKKVLDMKRVTFLEWKQRLNPDELKNTKVQEKLKKQSEELFGIADETTEFSPDQLRFLYEIDSQIQGFGYTIDPRIEEIRDKRNQIEDIKILYGFDLEKPDKQALQFIYFIGDQPTPVAFSNLIYELQNQRNAVEDIKVLYSYDLENPDKETLQFIYQTDDRPEAEWFSHVTKKFLPNRNPIEDIKVLYGYDLENPDKQALEFLYTIDGKPVPARIYSLIYQLRTKRNPDHDMAILFECKLSQIAHNLDEIKTGTKVYVGQLVPGIFERLQTQGIEHIYTSFPERKINIQQIQIGGKTKQQLLSELSHISVNIDPYARSLITNSHFTTLPVSQTVDTVVLHVGALGLPENPTLNQIYRKVQELGLELCPAEVGPHFFLQHTPKPDEDYYYVGMGENNDLLSDTYKVFTLNWRNEGLFLEGRFIFERDHFWSPIKFIFILPKSKSQQSKIARSFLQRLLRR